MTNARSIARMRLLILLIPKRPFLQKDNFVHRQAETWPTFCE